MSTNIRNGRIIRHPIGRCYDLLLALKPEMAEVERTSFDKLIAHRLQCKLDAQVVSQFLISQREGSRTL